MALDLAVDPNMGDLLIAPNRDFEVRTGQATVDQRIRTRIRIQAGSWDIDPTGGELGSQLHGAMRLSIERALAEVPLMIREALSSMHDIDVRDVICELNANSPKAIDITILYAIVEDGDETELLSTTNMTIEG